jgi:hypothetical protein
MAAVASSQDTRGDNSGPALVKNPLTETWPDDDPSREEDEVYEGAFGYPTSKALKDHEDDLRKGKVRNNSRSGPKDY